jgi:hypothetical protein
MSQNYIETIKFMIPHLELVRIEDNEDGKVIIYREKIENRGIGLELKKGDSVINAQLFYIPSVDKKGNFSNPKPVISKTLPGKLLDIDPNSLIRLFFEEWF